jgi:hypothetical protein
MPVQALPAALAAPPPAAAQDAALFARGRFFGPGRPIGGPREAFLAIHWFTYLAQGTDSAVIFLYLDYYLEAGWLGEAEHQWLTSLAKGLATRRDNVKWADFGLDAGRLAKNHLRNLKFLDKMFGATLQHGEAQYLQQTLDTLLQEE